MNEFDVLQLAIDIATKHGKHNQKAHGRRFGPDTGGGSGGVATGTSGGGASSIDAERAKPSALSGDAKDVSDAILAGKSEWGRQRNLSGALSDAQDWSEEFVFKARKVVDIIDRLPADKQSQVADIRKRAEKAIAEHQDNALKLADETRTARKRIGEPEDVTREHADTAAALRNRAEVYRPLRDEFSNILTSLIQEGGVAYNPPPAYSKRKGR